MDSLTSTKAAGLALFGGLFLTGLGLAMPRQRWAKQAVRVGGGAVAVGTGIGLWQYMRAQQLVPAWADDLADRILKEHPPDEWDGWASPQPMPIVRRSPTETQESGWSGLWDRVADLPPGVVMS